MHADWRIPRLGLWTSVVGCWVFLAHLPSTQALPTPHHGCPETQTGYSAVRMHLPPPHVYHHSPLSLWMTSRLVGKLRSSLRQSASSHPQTPTVPRWIQVPQGRLTPSPLSFDPTATLCQTAPDLLCPGNPVGRPHDKLRGCKETVKSDIATNGGLQDKFPETEVTEEKPNCNVNWARTIVYRC